MDVKEAGQPDQIRCVDCGGPLTEGQQAAARKIAMHREEVFGQYDTSYPCAPCNIKRIDAMGTAARRALDATGRGPWRVLP